MKHQYRDLYEILVERSKKDFGEAPKYNKEYRELRWSGNGHRTPIWKQKLFNDVNRKRNGTFNTSNRYGIKVDTERSITSDIRKCIELNIPFKTKTFRYDHTTQILEIGETGRIFYSLIKGHIIGFTYGEIYDKRMTMILSRFSIHVKKRKDKFYIIHNWPVIDGETPDLEEFNPKGIYNTDFGFEFIRSRCRGLIINNNIFSQNARMINTWETMDINNL